MDSPFKVAKVIIYIKEKQLLIDRQMDRQIDRQIGGTL